MRLVLLFLVVCGSAWPQALTEAAAAAAGGSVGGVAGKKVGEGVSTIFEKVAGSVAKAADTKEAKPAPSLEVGPGVPGAPSAAAAPKARSAPKAPAPSQRADRSLVPPPPPLAHKATVAKPAPVAEPEPVVEAAPPPPPPPPAPEVTPADLRTLTSGMGRLAVLKLGAPASRVTMVDAGHLLEIYRYANRDASFGVVRLNDGVVSSVEVRP